MNPKFHPAAEVCPLMTDKEISDLSADIKAHGQRLPIILHRDGRIIDGRNRWLACEMAHIKPRCETYQDADGTILDYVVSMNEKRRHMTVTQLGMMGAEIANLMQGQDLDYANKLSNSANARFAREGGITTAVAAQMVGTSDAAVRRGRQVLIQGTPEEIAAAKAGKATLTAILAKKSGRPKKQKLKREPPDEFLNAAGRRFPKKPIEKIWNNGLTQLENTLDFMLEVVERENVSNHPNLDDWIERLEKARALLRRLIRMSRNRSENDREDNESLSQ